MFDKMFVTRGETLSQTPSNSPVSGVGVGEGHLHHAHFAGEETEPVMRVPS